jgi:hypothetical protein
MGWLIQNDSLPRDEIIPHLKKHVLSGEDSHRKLECLDAALVGSTVYAACRTTFKAADEEKGIAAGYSYVFAAVILTSNAGGFGYKSMDESMGPNEVDCPVRIMKLLTPIDRVHPSMGMSYAKE